MANETTNIEWYFAEDNNKDLRQVVLCIPQGLQKESRFGTLMLSAKYRNLIESEHGTGFFRMDSDAGPFLLTRLDGYTDKLVEGSIKIAFSFFRTEYGGLVGVYIGMESRSLCEAFDKPYPFLEMINGLDERDTTVKLYDDAFSNDTLVVSIADRSMSTTSFYDENSGSFSEANSPQCVYDIDIDLPQECREVLQKELADVLSYHDNMSGYSRDFQQSVQCVYGVMPMGENPILPKVQEAVQEKVAEKIIGQQDPEGQGESTDTEITDAIVKDKEVIANNVNKPAAATKTPLAVWSLVLGCVGLIPFFSINLLILVLAVILGHAALKKINRSDILINGKRLSIAGLVIGYVGLVFYISSMIPPAIRAHKLALRTECASNLHEIGGYCQKYMNDNKGKSSSSLYELANEYGLEASKFVSPYSGNKPGDISDVDVWSDYVIVPGLDDSASSSTVMAFSKPECYPGEGGNILFADGHVKWSSYEGYVELTGNININKIREAQLRLLANEDGSNIIESKTKMEPSGEIESVQLAGNEGESEKVQELFKTADALRESLSGTIEAHRELLSDYEKKQKRLQDVQKQVDELTRQIEYEKAISDQLENERRRDIEKITELEEQVVKHNQKLAKDNTELVEEPTGQDRDPAVPITGEITAMEDDSIAISIGSKDGVVENMRFWIIREDKFIGYLDIIYVEPEESVGRLRNKQEVIVEGDVVTTDKF